MNSDKFNEFVRMTQAATGELLIRKGQEYADDADRLANFKLNAAKQGVSPLDVWKNYLDKHISSIDSYVRRIRETSERMAMQEVAGEVSDFIYKQIAEASQQKKAPDWGQMAFLAMDEVAKTPLRQRISNYEASAIEEVEANLSEPIEGRLHDIINYCILGGALREEQKQQSAVKGD